MESDIMDKFDWKYAFFRGMIYKDCFVCEKNGKCDAQSLMVDLPTKEQWESRCKEYEVNKDLLAQIEQSQKEISQGKYITLKTKEDIEKYCEEL